MKTHVDFSHLQLIVQRKLVLTNNVVEIDNHGRRDLGQVDLQS
jgi:hypothetical protein